MIGFRRLTSLEILCPGRRCPPQSDISVLITDPLATVWDEGEIVDIRVDNDEVWTVNKAMLDDSFWEDQELKDLGKKMEAVEIGKPKVSDSLALAGGFRCKTEKEGH